jgi:hypothetical protein
MFKTTLLKLLAAAAFWGASCGAQAGLLNGESLSFTYLFPDQASIMAEEGDRVVGTGVEFNFYDMFWVDIADTSITINNFFASDSETSFDASSFNGFVIRDLNSAVSFTSVVLDSLSNMIGLDASRISFDAHNIYVNWQGLSFNSNTQIQLNLAGIGSNASSLPESNSLIIIALGLMALSMRRRVARSI